MTSIRTLSGRKVDLLSPQPSDIYLADIAAGLAKQCRYYGQIPYFYSVAEHSVAVSRYSTPDSALCGLLHDASEAYLGDVSGPLKHTPELAGYREIEYRWQYAIAEHYGLTWPIPEEIHELDRVVLAQEMRDIRGFSEWTCHLPPRTRMGWSPEEAEMRFVQRAAQLAGGVLARELEEMNVVFTCNVQAHEA